MVITFDEQGASWPGSGIDSTQNEKFKYYMVLILRGMLFVSNISILVQPSTILRGSNIVLTLTLTPTLLLPRTSWYCSTWEYFTQYSVNKLP